MRLVAVLGLALAAAGCASAPPGGDGAGRIAIDTRPVATDGPEQAATIHGVLRLPAQPGRVPAVILMPPSPFHGAADDWTAIGPCRDDVARMRTAGRNVSLIAYEGAHHGFDSRDAGRAQRLPNVLNGSACSYTPQPDGRVLDASGQPASRTAPCVRRGATVGYDARSHAKVVADVKAFLAEALARQSR